MGKKVSYLLGGSGSFSVREGRRHFSVPAVALRAHCSSAPQLGFLAAGGLQTHVITAGGSSYLWWGRMVMGMVMVMIIDSRCYQHCCY